MQRFEMTMARRGLREDCRGVSTANVTILVVFAALAMPGFIALGDGLAENVVGTTSGTSYGALGPSSANSGPNSGPWGNAPGGYTNSFGESPDSNGVPPDNWGGGVDPLFVDVRPENARWEQHQAQAPDTFTGGPGDFGAWGSDVDSSGQAGAPQVGEASAGGSPAASSPATSSAAAYADADGATSGPSVANTSLAAVAPADRLDSLGESWLGRYYSATSPSTSTAIGMQVSAMAAAEGEGMTPEDAINTVLDNLGAFTGGQSLRSIEMNGVQISLSKLQDIANGDDPELAAVARYILEDRALREALTGGGSVMSSEDLRALAEEVEQAGREGQGWLSGEATRLEAKEIDLAIKSTEDGNPPGWARNSAHVLGADFDLLADSSGPNGRPRMSADTLSAVIDMDEQQWAEFQAARGIDSNFTLAQVQGAANAALNSGLFDYLDAPPGMGVETNGLVGREMLLSFSDESQRQGDSWAEYLKDDNATDASTSELLNEDGANAMDGEPLVLREMEGDLFSGTVADAILEQRPGIANMLRAEGLDRQADLGAEDVVQGEVGDCWAMSGLAAFAEHQPDVIRNALTDNRDGTFTVRLHDLDGNLVETTVDNEFAASTYTEEGAAFAQTDRALWAAVMEKAMTEVLDGRNGVTNDMMTIDGGQDAMIHEMLTGREAETVYFVEPTEGNATESFLDERPENAVVETSATAVASQLETWVDEGRAISVTSSGDPENATINANGITSGHSYTVMKVEGDRVTLRDPRGDEFNVTISAEEFNSAFVSMTSSAG